MGARRFRGFTLIELLVVMTIITVLAGMILAVVRRARQQSWKMVCMSQMKMIGNSVLMYAEDYDGWVPAAHNYPDEPWWTSILAGGYLGTTSKEILVCPVWPPYRYEEGNDLYTYGVDCQGGLGRQGFIWGNRNEYAWQGCLAGMVRYSDDWKWVYTRITRIPYKWAWGWIFDTVYKSDGPVAEHRGKQWHAYQIRIGYEPAQPFGLHARHIGGTSYFVNCWFADGHVSSLDEESRRRMIGYYPVISPDGCRYVY